MVSLLVMKEDYDNVAGMIGEYDAGRHETANDMKLW